MLYASFWRRNLGFFKLAIASNIEYRLNFLVDALVQPSLSSVVEVVLWISIFAGAGMTLIGGFPVESYISYALWATFMGRISSSWMYEFRMIDEIDSGSINSLIVRPMSFYEYYLSQLLGYKAITTAVSLSIPLILFQIFDLPFHLERLPLCLLLVFYYLILVHSLSFIVASLAFYLNRAHSFTAAKNLALWLLSGELFPLDLLPEPFKTIFAYLPFSSGVYVPTAYVTGRVGIEAVSQGFISVTVGLIVANLIGWALWKQAMKSYSGTGA